MRYTTEDDEEIVHLRGKLGMSFEQIFREHFGEALHQAQKQGPIRKRAREPALRRQQ